MWPWGHLAVGYLLYASYTRLTTERPPTEVATITLALGTQFPDLIDKPLAWWVAVLPNGRSLAHSLFTVLAISTILVVVFHHRRQLPIALSFIVGSLSHLFADALHPAVTGDFSSLGFLAWPLVPAIEYETEKSFLAHFATLQLDAIHAFELVLVALAVGWWIRDGVPGLQTALALPGKLSRRLGSTT